MARTEIISTQIKNNTVNKDDIDVSTTTKALITKVIAGTNINIGSTGVDPGTGDVTVNGPVIDSTPTNGSNNLVTSNGVYDAIAAIPGGGDMVLADVQTVTGAKTFNDGKLKVAGSTSGTMEINTQAVAGTSEVVIAASGAEVYTFPAATGTLVSRDSTDTLTNKTITDATNTVYDSRIKIVAVPSNMGAITSATGVEVTDLTVVAGIGVFLFDYVILWSSTNTGNGIKFGINHDGTVTKMSAQLIHGTTGTSAATGVATNAANTLTGTLVEGRSTIALSTTAPNLGPCTGVNATTEQIIRIYGIIEISASGNLELWCGSEASVNVQILKGSCLTLTKLI